MPSPFPGMDPYLEKPGIWPDVHHTLISGIQGSLAAQLRPKYLVRIDERAYISDETDETLKAQLRVPEVEITGRPGWEDAVFSPREDTSAVEIAEPVIACTHAQTPETILAPKQISAADRARCAEVGATLAAGLAAGVF